MTRIEIPEVLQREDFRFCLLKQKSKTPFEKAWQENGYTYKDPVFIAHISAGGNYGVIGGYGNLRILDIDGDPNLAEKLSKKLRTLAIETGSGGAHFYFISDYESNHVLKDQKGELRANNYQCVGPGSVHPSGNIYKINDDLPIREIPSKELLSIIGGLLKPKVLEPAQGDPKKTQQKKKSRSETEMSKVVSLIYEGLSKEEVFEQMKAFVKWTTAPPQYRELTYNKALGFTEQNPSIWEVDSNGKKKLLIKNLVDIMCKFKHFITIGDRRPEIYFYDGGYYRRGGEQEIQKGVEILTNSFANTYQTQEVVNHIKRRTYVDSENFKTEDEPHLLCVGNGILNLITGGLTPHDPDMVFFQKVKVDWVPGADCPNIKRFIEEVARPEDVDTIQEFVGFCLWREYLFKKALVFVGPQDSGKTTLLKVINALIGEENISGESLQKVASDKFSAINLKDKMLNLYDDLPFADLKDTGTFKIVTGGGHCTGEYKFGDKFRFKNFSKLCYATNKLAPIKDPDDLAYYSRWIVLFFNNQFILGDKKTKPDLIKELITKNELEGFLVWAYKGLKRLLKNKKFSYDKSELEIKDIMEYNSNSVLAFAQDCLLTNREEYITKQDMYNFYVAYCNQQNIPIQTKSKFGREIQKVGCVEGKADTPEKKSTWVWRNISLNTGNTAFLKIIYKINKYNNKNLDYTKNISRISRIHLNTPCPSCGLLHKEGVNCQKLLKKKSKHKEVI